MLKSLHIMLAYLTVLGFTVRGLWAVTDSPLRRQAWVRVVPHVIDTALLVLGVALAVQLGASLADPWLAAKLSALLAYIAFGVLTMRATARGLQLLGFAGALLSVAYIFAVAFTRSPLPFAA